MAATADDNRQDRRALDWVAMLRALSSLLVLALPRLLLALPATQEPAAATEEARAEPGTPPPGGYLGTDEILERARLLGRREGVTVRELGATAEGRPLLVVGLGERGAPGRPAVLLLADPSGARPGASQLALALAERFAGAGAPLLEAATFYLIPVANPDAAAHAGAGLGAWQGAPVDEDRDGRDDEDPREDLDGDGLVLSMRVPDPAGAWLADPGDPRALRKPKAEDSEKGAFRLLDEGTDQDGDRLYNEDGPGGRRLDANWPHRWQEHAPAAGAFPLAEPLNRALADFVLERPNVAIVIVLGEEDELAAPPGGSDGDGAGATEPRKADATLLKALGARLYEDLKDKPRGGERGRGNFADWAYFQAGRLVLRSAVWSPPLDGEGDDEVKLLRWNDAVLGGAGFVTWRPFDHPQLGPVEIGGWRPLVRDNPPIESLPALVERWSAFLDGLAPDFARLAWSRVEVRDLGGGVREARATLVDAGLLPTVTAMGEATRRLLPVIVELHLPAGGRLLGGSARQSVPRLASGDAHDLRWLFQVPADGEPVVVRAEAASAGSVEAILEVTE